MPSLTTTTHESSTPPPYLSRSLSSLSRSRSSNNLVVRSYKRATQYYLTRRFREAWETITPILTPGDGEGGLRDSGIELGREGNGGSGSELGVVTAAAVTQSSRGTRVKVWVFYLSLIHAVVELGVEEGEREFGGREAWRWIVQKARSGSVWEEVVREGYGAMEGEVDAEVVVNLATLLLGHMVEQKSNQERLEAWLGAQGDVGGVEEGGMATPMSVQSAGSPRVLQARLKVLELFVLHVLPERGEWAYARECVEGSGVLDEERREAFLSALEGLKEERDGVVRRERELGEQRDRERVEEEARRAEEEQKAREREEEVRKEEQKAREARAAAASEQNGSANSNGSANNRPKRTSFNPSEASSNNSNNTPARQPPRSARKPPTQPPSPQTLYARISTLLQSTRSNLVPSLLQPRLLLFLLAFVLLAAKRTLRLRLRRALADSWDKVRRTVGMGVKVSYV